ncbi:hypothetical protein [Acidicapsa acidisoli]|uniref:hypothetical protein n=1 Tax=Acidicapsa acidisoli TaxID=1615681 RepID=UPI0021E0B2A3|nr:hypothetical protein [Acidicapsa acidisoli]
MAASPPLPKSFEDAARHHVAVEAELERICGSAHFRTSKRSCEFLRYIVRVTLDGRMDSLKERTIGIDLFGRDTSYEPSSDASVRVRANEVRKRLTSYYASSVAAAETCSLKIQLPTGSYVPRFTPVEANTVSLVLQGTLQGNYITASPAAPVSLDLPSAPASPFAVLPQHPIGSVVPPVQALTLMRPALFALLVCALLLRHQMENREEYLRFWDRLLSGRSAMVLSVSPQDRVSLASSLYPLVWVAGRYGVDATMQEDSLTDAKPDATSSVRVSYATPREVIADRRLRWTLTIPAVRNPDASSSLPKASAQLPAQLLDGHPSGTSVSAMSVSSAALLTILSEDASTLRIQGTDADAIRRLLEELTVERNFPSGLVEQVEHLDGRHGVQVLVYRDTAGEWRRNISWGGA